jgi:hypothetical protein
MAEVLLTADPDLTIRNRFGGLSHIPASERGHAAYVELVLDRTDIAVDHVNDLGVDGTARGGDPRAGNRTLAADC